MSEDNFKEFPTGVAALAAVFLLALLMSSIGMYQFTGSDSTQVTDEAVERVEAP